MQISILVGVLSVLCLSIVVQATTKGVLLYSSKVGQLVTSNTLLWQNFGDEKLLSSAVEAAKHYSGDESYPIYVCRAKLDAVIVSGHTEKHDSRTVCVVSMHSNVRTHHNFDVLINKDDGAKLTWKLVNQFNSSIPNGAISSTSTGHVSNNFCFFSFQVVFWDRHF